MDYWDRKIKKMENEIKILKLTKMMLKRDNEKFHNRVANLTSENKELKQAVKDYEHCIKTLEKCADEWMNDYQKLKDKYEPTKLVEQDAR